MAFETAVVGFFADTASALHVPRSWGLLYGTLFASPVPLSFADIESRLDLSKGSISQGLRALRDIGAIKEASSVGDRHVLFTPDTEIRQVLAHFLQSRVEQQLTIAQSRFKEFGRTLGAYSNGEQKILKQRVKKLEAWHGKTRALLPLIRTFLKISV